VALSVIPDTKLLQRLSFFSSALVVISLHRGFWVDKRVESPKPTFLWREELSQSSLPASLSGELKYLSSSITVSEKT
jgi:hypothetical protein